MKLVRESYMRAAATVVFLATACAVTNAQVVDPKWSQPVMLSEPSAVGDRATLVVDQTGATHAVWVDRIANTKVSLKYARFDGEAWSAPLEIRNSYPAKIGIVSATIDKNDQLHVAWTEATTDWTQGFWPVAAPVKYTRVKVSESMTKANWPEPRTISVAALYHTLRVAPDGRLHLVYTDLSASPGQIFHVMSENVGETWSAPKPVPSGAFTGHVPHFSSMEIGSDGVLHVVWEYKPASSWQTTAIAYARSTDGGVTWARHTLLDEAGSNPSLLQYGFPVIAVNGSNVHAIWSGGGFANVGRRHRYSQDSGLNWSPVTQILGSLHGFVEADALEFDPAGRLHFVDLLRFPQGVWQTTWQLPEWADPSLFYLQLSGPGDVLGDRINTARITLSAARDQLVTSFVDSEPGHAMGLYAMNTIKPVAYIPYFIDGAGYSTTIVVNNLTADPLRATVKALDSSGALQPGVFADVAVGEVPTIPLGGLSARWVGSKSTSESIRTGYASVEFDRQAPTVVSALMRFPTGEEAVLRPSPLARSFSLFVEQNADTKTLVAALRFTGHPIRLQLYHETGYLLGERSWDLGGRQKALYIDELFDIPETFRGQLLMRSAGDFTVCGLRLGEGKGSYMPAVNLDTLTENEVTYMPHVAEGWGWSMIIGTSNHSAQPAKVRISFWDPDGKPQALPFDAGTVNETTIDLAVQGFLALRTTSASDPIKTGFIKYEFTGQASGYAVFGRSTGLEAGVTPLRPGRRFALIAQRNFAIETGVAVLRLGKAPVRFSMYDADGVLVGAGNLPFQSAQGAAMVSAIAALPSSFLGTMVLESDEDFVPLGLRIGERLLSTTPVVRY